jgi:hypothetical protein
MNDLVVRVRVKVSVMYTVRAIVSAFWFVTLQPPPIRCRSKRSRPPSIYDLEVVPCLTAVAIWHYACATWKERGTNPTRSCMDLVLEGKDRQGTRHEVDGSVEKSVKTTR